MALPPSAMATTGYVSDQLSVSLRQGPGTQYRIKAMADSGTRVDILEVDDGWSKVRTPDGKTGFVLTRFLSDQPSARGQLSDLKTQVASLEQHNGALKKKLADAAGSASALGDAKSKLVTENTNLKNQLDHIKKISADAVRTAQENQNLRQQLTSAQTQAEQLERANKAHKNRVEGMVIGALILVVGIILGLILPLLRRRRRSNWA